jgi:hypothetical protein
VTRLLALSATSAALIATVALAQAADETGPNNDPNQVVCVKEKQIGSRLSTSRVCRTRSEWEQVRIQSRQVVERVQGKPTSCPLPPQPC